MRQKKRLLLSCIAVFAIATFVGTIAFESNTYKSNDLLIQDVEALTEGDADQDDQGSSIYTYPNAYPYARVCGYRISHNRICHETVTDCLGGGYGCNSRRCPYHG